MLQTVGEVRVWPDELPPAPERLRLELADADAVLSLLTDRIDAAVMDAAPQLKVISNFAVGYDNIDVAAATARGIPVGNTPGVLTETSADTAFALLMAAARRIGEAERYVHNGLWRTWSPTLLLGQDVHGATLGIIGLGRIGQAVARRAQGFGMRVLYHGGSDTAAAQALGAEARTLDDLLRESDFISLHVPYKPETHHLINARALALMKPTAILINTARGGVVDSAALYEALASGQLAYAALDVTDPEPIPLDDPLLTLENCFIVPHIGSASVATRNKMAAMAAQNLIAGLHGERLPHCVNPEVYAP
ncbi:MAG: D-glycerate dehydrogenase [Anaerolineae bacterium]